MIVLITQGDPRGIGPEIAVKAVKLLKPSLRKRIVLVGVRDVFIKAGWSPLLSPLLPVEVPYTSDKKKYAALSSFKSFEIAVKLVKNHLAGAVVTAPISKDAWIYSGIRFTSHTDYFRKLFKKDLLMSFKKGKIISALVCEHVAIKEISKYIKRENLINKINLLESLILKSGVKKASIAVSGLNPHCGENGLIGKEEIEEIIPALKYLKLKKKKVYGPFNPDDCLKMNLCDKVEGCLFMYHDQLIPLLKALSLNKNDIIHITWGLDFIRTSPTHGTAFDIAGKNIADPTSMFEAIKTAFNLSHD